MSTHARTLILSDAGMASLVAAGVVREGLAIDPKGPREASTVMVVPWPIEGAHADAKRRCVAMQAEHFGFTVADWPAPHGAPNASAREREVDALLALAQGAARAGADRMIWPTRAVAPTGGVDVDALARALDCSLLVSRLVALDAQDHGRPGFAIETPYADLGDSQLADLCVDMDLPWTTCWWWRVPPKSSPEAGAEHTRWMRALAALGVRAPGAAEPTRGVVA